VDKGKQEETNEKWSKEDEERKKDKRSKKWGTARKGRGGYGKKKGIGHGLKEGAISNEEDDEGGPRGTHCVVRNGWGRRKNPVTVKMKTGGGKTGSLTKTIQMQGLKLKNLQGMKNSQ